MDIYFSCMFFIFGLIFGSFYNVCAYRLPKKESLLFPSSHCPNCNHVLNWYELIPVFSYLIQRGKCRNCKAPISPFYMVFELLTGIMFMLSYIVFGLSMKTVIAITFVSMLDIIIISDILYTIINDSILVIFGLLLFFEKFAFNLMELDYITIKYAMDELLNVCLNGLIPFMIMYLIKIVGDFMFKRESMGGGDIKLMAILGIVIGAFNAVSCIFIAAFIALPISIILLKIKSTHEIPFGPFLSLAAILLFFLEINVIDFLKI